MRIIKPKTVKEWAKAHADAEKALERWMTLVQDAGWSSIVDVRAVFPSADPVTVASGRAVVVFNIGGNKYRLIAAIHYDRQNVYTLEFMTHAEYDKDNWKEVL